MLGNFSFGDYFKKEAITWAWEFITEVVKLPAEKIWVTIYKDDEDAYKIWTEEVGFPKEKIVRLGKEDNYWGPPGPTGPCGPDSEIFFDKGPKPNCPDPENCSPACECGRFLEFYNLVFTEFNQDENGNLSSLSRKNIDTGMGLERITSIIQNVSSNYETDLFMPIIRKAEEITNMKYGENHSENVALRVIADHVRSAAFMLMDGVLPSNDGRGYILKRIIRRALRFGWLHNVKTPFLNKIIPVVVSEMGKAYPELIEKKAFLIKIIKGEEEKFLKTMEQGLSLLDEIIIKSDNITGEDAFKLYDTFGFPIEVTQEIAEERNLSLDIKGYNKLMSEQKNKARAARGNKQFLKREEIYESLGDKPFATEFIGYETLNTKANIKFIIKDEGIAEIATTGNSYEMITYKTPFYSERGGQVADTGTIEGKNGTAIVEYVFNPFNEIISHKIKVVKGTLSTNEEVILEVDKERRIDISRNHSSTHLLHAALRSVLGSHVKQAGSLITPERLRFDFSHFQPLNKQEIRDVEELVNKEIMKANRVATVIMNLEEAQNKGVTALFEDKYGDKVRVVEMGTFSSELCGGTHVSNTGEIGSFKILSENGISSGVRRIEALTGTNALDYYSLREKIISGMCKVTGSDSTQLENGILKILDENKNYTRKIKSLEEKMSNQGLNDLIVEDIAGLKVLIVQEKNLQKDIVRNLSDIAIKKVKSGIVIILNETDSGVGIIVKVSKDIAGKKAHAGNIARGLANILGGNGGGRPDFAQAGGKDATKIPLAVSAIEKLINN